MWLLWGSVAVVTAGATVFIFAQARAAAARTHPETTGQGPESEASAPVKTDLVQDLRIRALKDLDTARTEGLLSEADYQAERAEIARRLLAEAAPKPPVSRLSPKAARLWLLAMVFASGVFSIGLYASLGAPDRPDQPFAARLARWTHLAQSRPDQLAPEQLVAVLEQVKAKQKSDPAFWVFLGRAQTEAGQFMAAGRSFEHAVRLRPYDAEAWSLLGQALTRLNEGKVSPDAKAAFEQALKFNPKAQAALYFLGTAELAEGHVDKGMGYWQSLSKALSPGDPREAPLRVKMALVAKGQVAEALADPEDDRRAAVKAMATARPEDRQAMIEGMVEGLSARLKDKPNDPEGWVRLVKAYGVLGRKADQDAAYDRAVTLFGDQPTILSALKAAKAGPKGAGKTEGN